MNCELSLLGIAKDHPFITREVLRYLMACPLTQARVRSWLMVA